MNNFPINQIFKINQIITTRFVVGGQQTPPSPLSQCPSVLVSRCPSVQERHEQGGTNETHKQGGMNETHKQKLHDLQNPKWPPGGLRMADVAK